MNLEGTYFWCSNIEEFLHAEDYYIANDYRWDTGGRTCAHYHLLSFPVDIGCSGGRLWVDHPQYELDNMRRLNLKSFYLKQYFK